jgi:hypothetical protein
VKCEAYFTGAAPSKRLQLDGLKRIGFCNPVNGYNFIAHPSQSLTLSVPHACHLHDFLSLKVGENTQSICAVNPIFPKHIFSLK